MFKFISLAILKIVFLAFLAYPLLLFGDDQLIDCSSLKVEKPDSIIIGWYKGNPVKQSRSPTGVNIRIHGNEIDFTQAEEVEWEVLFGSFRLIAEIKDGNIFEPRNTLLKNDDTFYLATQPEVEVNFLQVFSTVYQYDSETSYCLYSAEISNNGIEPHSLYSNTKSFRLSRATRAQEEIFRKQIYPRSYCANHNGMFLMDVPEEDIPPCDEPKLLGLSDIDRDSRPEYWTTHILRWDTGIGIWEQDGKSVKMIDLMCPGCGD